MKLDVSHVPEEGLAVSVDLDPREVDIPDNTAELKGPLRLEGRVLKAGEKVLLESMLRGALRLTCSRCLKGFVQPFEIEVSATYVQTPEAEPERGEGSAAALEDSRIAFLGDEIDLVSGIREDLALNVPLKPLCKEDCRGLCPQCGTDRNERECTCQKETVDMRLAALRDIQTQMESQDNQHKGL